MGSCCQGLCSGSVCGIDSAGVVACDISSRPVAQRTEMGPRTAVSLDWRGWGTVGCVARAVLVDVGLFTWYFCEEVGGKFDGRAVFVPLSQVQVLGETRGLLQEHGFARLIVVACVLQRIVLGGLSARFWRRQGGRQRLLLFEWDFCVSIVVLEIPHGVTQASCHR
jgi:hypothetical protein